MLAIAVGIAIAMNKTVTIVDGRAQEVGTMSGSVEGALDAARLTVAEHDTVAPGSTPRSLTACRSSSNADGCSP